LPILGPSTQKAVFAERLVVTIRSFVYLCFLALTVILYSVPLALFGWFLSPRQLGLAGQQWGRLNLAGLRAICGLAYRTQGLDDLPTRNCIVLSKHQSAWETIALRALLPPEQTWVLKRELLSVPFFGWALARFRPIAIERNEGRQALRKLLDEGTRWLGRGHWVIIFPEGTRVAPGQHRRYSQGGAMLAKRAGATIVPVAHNAGVFWRRRDLRKYSGTIDLVFGPPIQPDGGSTSDLTGLVEEWIEGTVASLPQSR
jgi:1-acyl-sn-glycerol-3-phosphate acyltransferase